MASSLHRGVLVDSPWARGLENIKGQVQTLREAAGERFDSLELCLTATVLNEADRTQAAERLAAQRGWQVAAETVLDMPSVLVGDAQAMEEHLERTREQTGVSYLVVRDSQMEAAANLVQRVTR
jgi:hypothetical protein